MALTTRPQVQAWSVVYKLANKSQTGVKKMYWNEKIARKNGTFELEVAFPIQYQSER